MYTHIVRVHVHVHVYTCIVHVPHIYTHVHNTAKIQLCMFVVISVTDAVVGSPRI